MAGGSWLERTHVWTRAVPRAPRSIDPERILGQLNGP